MAICGHQSGGEQRMRYPHVLSLLDVRGDMLIVASEGPDQNPHTLSKELWGLRLLIRPKGLRGRDPDHPPMTGKSRKHVLA